MARRVFSISARSSADICRRRIAGGRGRCGVALMSHRLFLISMPSRGRCHRSARRCVRKVPGRGGSAGTWARRDLLRRRPRNVKGCNKRHSVFLVPRLLHAKGEMARCACCTAHMQYLVLQCVQQAGISPLVASCCIVVASVAWLSFGTFHLAHIAADSRSIDAQHGGGLTLCQLRVHFD